MGRQGNMTRVGEKEEKRKIRHHRTVTTPSHSPHLPLHTGHRLLLLNSLLRFSADSTCYLFRLPCSPTMASAQLEQAYEKYRYEALFGTWLLVTGATFMRIRRQPYSTRLKVEQYESIFKGTSLGAMVLGIGMSPKRGMRRVA